MSQAVPVASQSAHVSPSIPHAVLSVPWVQVKPPSKVAWQQPFGQVVVSQVATVDSQTRAGLQVEKPFAVQSLHAAPRAPHSVASLPLWH